VFEPSQLLWHRGSDLSKVQDLSRCATILDITNEKVTFNFREEEVILEIKTKNVNAHGRPLGTGGSPPVESKLITENHWKISKEERDQVLKKPEDYLKQVGLVAYYEKGNFAGVKLKEVPSGSLPEKRGFQKNDVVTHINGMRISSMQHLETLAKSEQNKRQFTLNLLRLGKTINLRFDVD
jgi:type II secretory pathway component PulC